jgi:hypothetical protein
MTSAQRPANPPAAWEGEITDTTPQQGSENPPLVRVPEFGPPPAPTPRALDWGSNGFGAGEVPGVSKDVGMGDLLAGALAAFQEGYNSLAAEGNDMTGPMAADTGPRRDAPNHRGPHHPRRPPGLQLAANPADRYPSDAAEALTDPELRLPDLTAEPVWRPPGTGRRSAAGE